MNSSKEKLNPDPKFYFHREFITSDFINYEDINTFFPCLIFNEFGVREIGNDLTPRKIKKIWVFAGEGWNFFHPKYKIISYRYMRDNERKI